jgi:hypothetical protein
VRFSCATSSVTLQACGDPTRKLQGGITSSCPHAAPRHVMEPFSHAAKGHCCIPTMAGYICIAPENIVTRNAPRRIHDMVWPLQLAAGPAGSGPAAVYSQGAPAPHSCCHTGSQLSCSIRAGGLLQQRGPHWCLDRSCCCACSPCTCSGIRPEVCTCSWQAGTEVPLNTEVPIERRPGTSQHQTQSFQRAHCCGQTALRGSKARQAGALPT